MSRPSTRTETPGPFDYARKASMRLWFFAAFLFLYAPIIVLVVVFSFNNSRRGGNVVWRGFTTEYYAKALGNESLVEAFTNSIAIAVISTLFATVLAALTALVLWRFRFPLKPLYEGTVALPIVIPEICMGVSLAVFFSQLSEMGCDAAQGHGR